MRPGGRPSGPLVLAGVLAALLLVLASLQWRWLGQISTDERERMQRSLRTQVTEFTQDFDRELTRAYFWLQMDRGAVPGVAAAASTGHFQRWFASAPHPALVSALYLVTVERPAREHDPRSGRPDGEAAADAAGAPRLRIAQYDSSRDQVVPVPESPPELLRVLERIRAQATTSDAERAGPAAGPAPVAAEGPALVIPRPPVPVVDAGGAIVFSQEERPWDYTVVMLDADYLRETFLPDLLKRHFGDTGAAAYRVSIVDRQSNAQVFCSDGQTTRCAIAAPDATEDFFEIRMREFNRFVVDDRRQARPGLPGVPTATVSPPNGRTAVNIVRPTDGDPRRPDRQPLWRADFAHQSGSLAAVVATTRRRNLFVSSSVLLLLGASIAMLVVSSARARKLAAQQMEFVAGVSHELRTPLAVIRSAAENLADGVVADTDQVQRYGQLIATEGRRLTEMVEQVMEFAGFDAGRTLDVRPFAAADIVQAAIDASGPLLAETGASVEFETPAGGLLVKANQPALARSVQNLISNAVKYGGDDRWVGVRVSPAGAATVAISISDRGSGIPEQDLPRIFEPFFRGQQAVDGHVHGSGLGLSLVERIVRQHGGRIEVQSTPRGTTFTLLIPAVSEAISPAFLEEPLAPSDRTLPRRGHAS